MSKVITRTAGIDTSKAKLDVAVYGGSEAWQLDNNEGGWRRLAAVLEHAGVERVGIEASGGYERGVVRHLRAAGFSVLVLQPMQVKAYARLTLVRAKNDALDAALIAAVAAAIEVKRPDPDLRLQELAQHLCFVEQVEDDIVRMKTRLEHIDDKRLRRLVRDDIVRLKKRRAAELARIRAVLCRHADLAKKLALVESVAGIGERTALAILIRMPELGRLSREEAASLAGLAPFDNDSGTRTADRHIAGGRARLRRSLFAAALPAAFRWNKALVAFYARLTKSGKSHNEALVACARKLLIYANAVVQRGSPWLPSPAQT